MGLGGGIGIGLGGASSQGVGQTDDDDISIFVQEIDARKPLGREREERERDLQRRSSLGIQGHDRFRTDSTDTTVRPMNYQHGHGHGRSVTSVSPPSPLSSSPNGRPSRFTHSPSPISTTATTTPITAATPGAAAGTPNSTLPRHPDPPMLRRGGVAGGSAGNVPIVNSQEEIEDRLRKMNDTFLKSLEGIGRKGSRGAEGLRTTFSAGNGNGSGVGVGTGVGAGTTVDGGAGAFQSSASGRLGPLTTTGVTPTATTSSPPPSTTRREVVSPPLSSPLAIVRPGGASYGRREDGEGDGDGQGEVDGGYMDPNEFAWDLDHSPSRPICRKPYSPYSYDGR